MIVSMAALPRTLVCTAARTAPARDGDAHQRHRGQELYTLLHDVQYRAEVARQQTTYNQPSHTSFHLGSDIDWSKVPVPAGA
jgi:hypothetical protein